MEREADYRGVAAMKALPGIWVVNLDQVRHLEAGVLGIIALKKLHRLDERRGAHFDEAAIGPGNGGVRYGAPGALRGYPP